MVIFRHAQNLSQRLQILDDQTVLQHQTVCTRDWHPMTTQRADEGIEHGTAALQQNENIARRHSPVVS